MSWKSIAWGALSQAQKSIDTVLSNANMPQEGYNDLDAFSDISGYVGSSIYSTPVPQKEATIKEDSDNSPLPSDHSDTEVCSQNNEKNCSSDTNQEVTNINQMSESTEFKEVDLFSVPSRGDSLLYVTENTDLNVVHENGKEQHQDAPETVSVVESSDDTPGIPADNQHSLTHTEHELFGGAERSSHTSSSPPIEQSDLSEQSSYSLSELREMLKVREVKLFELHESYAQLHDKYELIKENARAEVDQLLAEKEEKVSLLEYLRI